MTLTYLERKVSVGATSRCEASQVTSVEHFLRSQVRGRVLVYIFKGRGQEWGETSVRSDLRAVTIASKEERAITTIGLKMERDDHHYNLIRSLAVFSSTVQGSKRFWIDRLSHGIKNGVSKSLLPRVGLLSQELGTKSVMGLHSRKGNLTVSNSEKKQAEGCLGDWRLLILTNPESRWQLSSLTTHHVITSRSAFPRPQR
jgi:hypothetical protein